MALSSSATQFAPLIVGIGGTARPGSTSERAATATLNYAQQLGAQTKLFGGDFVARLPLYIPDRKARTPEECEFIETIRRCDGVIVSTPGYHGGISGPVKNILDLLEDTARDVRPYLTDRAFGCIVSAYGWQACGTTLVSLRVIAHALRAWPTPFGAALNASTPLFETDGTCLDDEISKQLFMVASQVVEFARWHRSGTLAAEERLAV